MKFKVKQFLDGKGDLSESQAVSHEDCDLGLWLYARGLPKFGTIPEMKELEKVHRDLHACVREIIQLKNAGKTADAEREFARLEEASDRIISLLDSVEEKVG